MKKITLMLAVALISVGCLAQKSNVQKAKNLSSALENPDFDAARTAIQAALEDPSTKDLTNTWYVAGLIGYNEFQYYQVKRSMGTQVSDLQMSAPTSESYDYWLVADKMSQIPNAKGKVDASTRKQIVTRMLDYYRTQTLISYGFSFYENGDYKSAYREFMKHLNMPSLDMMQDPKSQQQMVKDTLYYTFLLYAGRFAYMAQMYPEAIEVFKQFRQKEVLDVANYNDALTAHEFLYQSYIDQKDTANAEASLKQSIEVYPKEAWFLHNLINIYFTSGRKQDAVDYLSEAIERDPQRADYYTKRGDLKLNDGLYDEALVDYEKAASLDANLADAQAGIGRVYYNKAVLKGDEANSLNINDEANYKKIKQEESDLYYKSMPYLEQAHKLAPDDRNVALLLKGLYFRFRETDSQILDKYNALNEELDK